MGGEAEEEKTVDRLAEDDCSRRGAVAIAAVAGVFRSGCGRLPCPVLEMYMLRAGCWRKAWEGGRLRCRRRGARSKLAATAKETARQSNDPGVRGGTGGGGEGCG